MNININWIFIFICTQVAWFLNISSSSNVNTVVDQIENDSQVINWSFVA